MVAASSAVEWPIRVLTGSNTVASCSSTLAQPQVLNEDGQTIDVVGVPMGEDNTVQLERVVTATQQLVRGAAPAVDQPEAGRAVEQNEDVVLLGASYSRRGT